MPKMQSVNKKRKKICSPKNEWIILIQYSNLVVVGVAHHKWTFEKYFTKHKMVRTVTQDTKAC